MYASRNPESIRIMVLFQEETLRYKLMQYPFKVYCIHFIKYNMNQMWCFQLQVLGSSMPFLNLKACNSFPFLFVCHCHSLEYFSFHTFIYLLFHPQFKQANKSPRSGEEAGPYPAARISSSMTPDISFPPTLLCPTAPSSVCGSRVHRGGTLLTRATLCSSHFSYLFWLVSACSETLCFYVAKTIHLFFMHSSF